LQLLGELVGSWLASKSLVPAFSALNSSQWRYSVDLDTALPAQRKHGQWVCAKLRSLQKQYEISLRLHRAISSFVGAVTMEASGAGGMTKRAYYVVYYFSQSK